MNKIVSGEQNSPRYSGDYPVHVNKIVPSKQEVPARVGSNCVNKIVSAE